MIQEGIAHGIIAFVPNLTQHKPSVISVCHNNKPIKRPSKCMLSVESLRVKLLVEAVQTVNVALGLRTRGPEFEPDGAVHDTLL